MKKIERLSISPNCYSVLKSDLDTLEAELEKQQWISVKDRLPNYEFEISGKRFVNVLVTDGKIVGEGDYTEGVFNFLGVPFNNCSHWKPFPDPPQEDEG